VLAITGRSATDVFAVGGGGLILHYDGQQWTSPTSGTAQTLHGVFTVEGEVFAVGLAGTILRLDSQGGVALPSPVSGPLRAIWGAAADDLFAAGDNATVLHWDGQTWSRVRSPRLTGTIMSIGGNRERLLLVGEMTPPLVELSRATWP
jgi:hypothetical protein